MKHQNHLTEMLNKRKKVFFKLHKKIFNYNGKIKYRYLMLFIFLIYWILFGKSWLFSLLIAPFISVPLRWILKPIGYLLRPLRNAFMRIFDALLTKVAQKRDLSTAKKKGITPDNVKQVFKFDEIKEEIESEFENLEKQIKSWQYNENIELKNEVSI